MSLPRDILHMGAQYNGVHRALYYRPLCRRYRHLPTQKKLRSSSFSPSSFDGILPLDCNNEKGSSIWYTCNSTSPPFLGCCKSDPCGASCAQADLVPAMLSTDIAARGVFLPTALTVSTAPVSSGGLSAERIADMALGGVAFIAIIAASMYT